MKRPPLITLEILFELLKKKVEPYCFCVAFYMTLDLSTHWGGSGPIHTIETRKSAKMPPGRSFKEDCPGHRI